MVYRSSLLYIKDISRRLALRIDSIGSRSENLGKESTRQLAAGPISDLQLRIFLYRLVFPHEEFRRVTPTSDSFPAEILRLERKIGFIVILNECLTLEIKG